MMLPFIAISLIDALSWVLIVTGSFFLLAGGIGLVRMPDLFTRMHAASVIDTAGAGLLILGMMLQAGFSLVTLKLAFILALFFFTGPVITHALAQAALHEKIKPLLSGRGRRRGR
ncbi:MAG: monovalent cation/H(+) antiporter subunit G [Pseudolabrys sp.]